MYNTSDKIEEIDDLCISAEEVFDFTLALEGFIPIYYIIENALGTLIRNSKVS